MASLTRVTRFTRARVALSSSEASAHHLQLSCRGGSSGRACGQVGRETDKQAGRPAGGHEGRHARGARGTRVQTARELAPLSEGTGPLTACSTVPPAEGAVAHLGRLQHILAVLGEPWQCSLSSRCALLCPCCACCGPPPSRCTHSGTRGSAAARVRIVRADGTLLQCTEAPTQGGVVWVCVCVGPSICPLTCSGKC